MNWYSNWVKSVYVTPEALKLASCKRALKKFSSYQIVPDARAIPATALNQHTLFITSSRGQTVGKCPGSRGHLCCNYITVDLYLGCFLGCSYCIMKSYLNFSPLTVYADPRPSIETLRQLAIANPSNTIRVGTGETGDSLLLDPIFELSREFIEGLADLPNVYLELKTKTHFVNHLLSISSKGNAIIGFSLNALKIQKNEELYSASMEDRIQAANKVALAGYGIAFHFDPIIHFPGWEEEYAKTIALLEKVPTHKIRWISLGTMRYTPALRDSLEDRPYLFEEFVLCRDGKYRYLQPLRIHIYRWFLDKLKAITPAPVYLCMESIDVWKKVFGEHPMNNEKLRGILKVPKPLEGWRW
ncbi:MAG: radical SAM protein [Spirochaetales bacterium]